MGQFELGRRALIRGAIALGVASGSLRPDEAAAIQEIPDLQASELLLARKLTFFGGAEFDRVGLPMLDLLRDLPVGFDNIDVVVALKSRDDTDTRIVRTVREYETARAEGYYHCSQADLTMSGWFELPSGVLKAVANAQPAKVSYFAPGPAALHDLSALSAELVSDAEDHDSAGNIAQAVADGKITADTSRAGVITLISGLIERKDANTGKSFPIGGSENHLEELLRADLNGDGIEEMLAYHHYHAIGGSLQYGTTVVLTRTSPDTLIRRWEAPTTASLVS